MARATLDAYELDERSVRRIRWVARFGLLWAVAIAGRLFYLQIIQHDALSRLALRQQQKLEEIRAPRGAILDRSGQPLAMSLPVDSVCINPLRVPDLAVSADILAKVLNLDAAELLGRMRVAVDQENGFLWVKRRITPQESERLRALNLEWIEFRQESSRFYPYKSLAAHVLGGVDFSEQGNAGVERSLNDDLEGHPGERRIMRDVKHRGFRSEIDAEPLAGKNIRLTLDSRIQFVAERELKASVEAHHCKTGSLVAMNPRTGEILAMASYPAYDPNEPPRSEEEEKARENQAVSAPFEPGSVFKVITLSAALETTPLRPQTIIPCGNGVITLYGRTIHDHGHYASLPMEDVLARSSNIGAIQIGLRIGDQNMYDYVRRFGFGKRTGIPLPGESPGVVRPLKVWQKSSIGSVAMGHEVMATTLQLAQACSVVANGGMLIRPRLVTGARTDPPRRVIRPETAITMRQMMEGVVIKPYGTGRRAKLAGYTSGGKTGTAQIYDNKTHQYTHLYNASFMGFAPVVNPAVVVVVTVNGASGLAGYGGAASAPVFREVAAAALRMLDVPKDLPDEIPAPESTHSDENDVAIAELGAQVAPELMAAVPQGPPLLAAAETVASGPRVPDFTGKSMRAILEEAASLGLPVEFAGSGLARGQMPPPGAILGEGERVRVRLGR